MKKISGDEHKLFSQYIYKISGIVVNESKAYLLESRLARLLDEQGCDSFLELYRKAVAPTGRTLERKIIDAVTTRETLFFRDTSPFDMLKYKILPDLIDKRKAASNGSGPISIRIWSAACSTGQETYSIAMVLKELPGSIEKYSFKLLGTDISDAAIAHASYGQYSEIEVGRGLEGNLLTKYFNANGGGWKIKDDIRAMVMFRRMNLMDPFSSLGKFDIILCRNVLIYFDPEDRKTLFNRIAGVLEQDGYLIIGSSETLMGVSSMFEPHRHVRSVFYQLADA
jgi:chemotaxis protein methyltransferase CheR